MRVTNAVRLVFVMSVAWTTAAAGESPETPEMPQPTKQHQWLQRLVGNWQTTVTIHMPGQPAMTSQGTATTRPVGAFWVQSEHRGEMMGAPFTGLQTLGFNAEKQQFVGTWIDSMSDYQWDYRGQLNDKRNQLTLLCEGPCPMKPGGLSKFKEVLEVEDDDHLTFTSSVQQDDGTWLRGMQIEYVRKR